MRYYHILSVLFILAGAIFYVVEKTQITPEHAMNHISHVFDGKQSELKTKKIPDKMVAGLKLSGGLFDYMGESTDVLVEEFGEPIRKDASAYDYEWWVYTDEESSYIQFGISNGEVVTVYAVGTDLDLEPIQIGESYEALDELFSFSEEVTYNNGPAFYTFQLDEKDLKRRPLVKITDSLFIQPYFDTFTDKLSSIRIMKGEVLLNQRPYALKYRGELPEPPDLSEKEWEQIESGMEEQIFQISNVVRHNHDQSILEWDEQVQEVAYLHSKDMAENNYFSHYGLQGEGLKERLDERDVFYFAAGENIAAQYVDAPAAVEGWLNSEGHREALLSNKYTHLGVGVFRFYYTQNFLTKP